MEVNNEERDYSISLKVIRYGHNALLENPLNQRYPLLMFDVQHLLLLSLTSQKFSSVTTSWCSLKEKKVKRSFAIIVHGISLEEYLSIAQVFTFDRLFQNKFHLLGSSQNYNSLVPDLIKVLTVDFKQKGRYESKGNIYFTLETRFNAMDDLRSFFYIRNELCANPKNTKDKFPRTSLLLTLKDMMENTYQLPLYENQSTDFVFSKDFYTLVTDDSPLFSVDCEMVFTGNGVIELAHIAVINEKEEEVYTHFVKPFNKITNYFTHKSGVNEESFSNGYVRLENVQVALKKILPPDAILVGQSLNFDLKVMKMFHPYVIDTSVIYNKNHTKWRKTSLKYLAKEYLDMNIQSSSKGHDPVEDAKAALRLVQLKLQRNYTFGNNYLIWLFDTLRYSKHRANRKTRIKRNKKSIAEWEKLYTLDGDMKVKDIDELDSRWIIDDSKKDLNEDKEIEKAFEEYEQKIINAYKTATNEEKELLLYEHERNPFNPKEKKDTKVEEKSSTEPEFKTYNKESSNSYLFVGKPHIKRQYSRILKQRDDRITFIKARSNRGVIRHACLNHSKNNVTIAHINLNKKKKTYIDSIKEIDTILNEVCYKARDNTLLFIIFNNDLESQNNVLFAGVKERHG